MTGNNASYAPFPDDLFSRWWQSVLDSFSAGVPLVCSTLDGHKRVIERMDGTAMGLRESGPRHSFSLCGKDDLRHDFEKLWHDAELGKRNLPEAREIHGIKNLIEFKRDLWERFLVYDRAIRRLEMDPVFVTDSVEPPPHVVQKVRRIVRDTALVMHLKRLYGDRCQRCGCVLKLPDGRGYSEGHHLKPLGHPHDGPDIEQNILIVCPNCHALLDQAAVTVDLASIWMHAKHPVAKTFVDYHNSLFAKHWSTDGAE